MILSFKKLWSFSTQLGVICRSDILVRMMAQGRELPFDANFRVQLDADIQNN